MYPTEFAYHVPTSLADAVTLLQGGGDDVKVLAGGQSLLPLMKLRLAEPATLVDIGRIMELRGIREDGDTLVIGATTTYRDVLDAAVAARRIPLFVEAVRQVGDMQVRARGTIGGSLAHADPAGDLPAVVLALDGEMTAMGAGGARTIRASDFFVDLLTTTLREGEILTAVRLPAVDQPRIGSAYVKHHHPASGYAVVGVAAVVRLAEDGACREARVGITGAGTHATRATGVEQALVGQPLGEDTLAAAAALGAAGLDLVSDTYASAEYRAHLTRVLTRRALAMAAARARGAPA
jgi:aerobic carbon-monoxide dehydrogenase medium subunit